MASLLTADGGRTQFGAGVGVWGLGEVWRDLWGVTRRVCGSVSTSEAPETTAVEQRADPTDPGQLVTINVERRGPLVEFTAMDEATRFQVRKVYRRHVSTSAVEFMRVLDRRLPVPIVCIQTAVSTLFGLAFRRHLASRSIRHHVIHGDRRQIQ